MFRFANEYYLYVLVALPLLVLLFVYVQRSREKRLSLMGDAKLLDSLVANRSVRKPWTRMVLWILVLAFVIIGLARPQFGTKKEKVKRNGIDLIIALDVSYSMNAADIQPSRIEKAKQAIARITDRLTEDNIGLIVFAGEPFTQIPITSDYASVRMYLPTINTNIVPVPGTAIGKAIDLGVRSFPDDGRKKMMVVITDGEDHEQEAVEAAARAVSKDVTVNTIGIGLPEGAPIPMQGSRDNFIKDRSGQVVVSKLDEQLLQEIAKTGKGMYVRANNSEIGLNSILDELEKAESKKGLAQTYTAFNEQFIWFFFAALIFLITEILMPETKSEWLRKFKAKYMVGKQGNRKIGVLMVLLMFGFTSAFAQHSDKQWVRKGNKLYEQKQFNEAEVAYRKAMNTNNQSFAAAYNTGDALYKQGKMKESAEWFNNIAPLAKTPQQKAQLYHNLGNSYFQNRQYKESVDAYKKALKAAPGDEATQYNLSAALRKLQQQNKNNNGGGGNNNKDKDKDKQKQQSKNDKNKDNKKQQQQQQPKLSKEDAGRMLDALQNEENNTRDKLQKQTPQQRKNVEKYW